MPYHKVGANASFSFQKVLLKTDGSNPCSGAGKHSDRENRVEQSPTDAHHSDGYSIESLKKVKNGERRTENGVEGGCEEWGVQWDELFYGFYYIPRASATR